MGARYVWGKYTAVQQVGLRTRYQQVSENISGSVTVSNIGVNDTFYVGSGYSFSSVSGTYSLTGAKAYTLPSGYVYDIARGYMTMTSGAMYYGEFRGIYGELHIMGSEGRIQGKKYTSQSYQEQYTYYAKGSFVEYVSSANSEQYPSDGYQDGYYYVFVGSDNIDPKAVTIPSEIEDGTTIQITVTPSDEKKYAGNVVYDYQQNIAFFLWKDLSTGTPSTTQTCEIAVGQSSAYFRVRASDDLGFVSDTWIYSENVSVQANQPPTAPGITVDNVYINQHLTVTLTPATDPDGTVASYIIQRRIDGGQWNQVQSGTSLTYTELVNPEWGTVAYRAAAVDNEGLQGPWATSQTFDVNPGWVIISGPDSDLGDRPGPFVLEFEVEVVGNPDQDSIVTKVMLDDRDLIVDLLLHDEDIVRIYFNTKYFAAGTHTVQVTASKEDYTPAMSVYTFNIPPLNVDLFQGAKIEVPQNAQGQPVAWQGLARCILGDDGRDVAQMCGDGLKLAQGNYSGTGTSGQSNPTPLTAGFQPKLAVILSADGATGVTILAPTEGSTATVGALTVTFTAAGLSYWASTPEAQFNASGTAYSYYIVG